MLGADHPDVALSLHNLGSMYYQQGKLTEAKTLLSRCLKIRQQVLGNDHPDTKATQEWLDKVQQAMLKEDG